jgi:O-antigen/teichoic acid export membrane protein
MRQELSPKARVAVSICMAMFTTLTNACVGFFLSPFIVRTLGVEAQGFTQLASNFVSYIALATIALNSMSARFIIIARQRGDIEGVGKYYTSIFVGNVVILAVLVLPIIGCVFFLDRLIEIPAHLVFDVKLLFVIVFINFGFSTLLSLWNNTFYICDRLYLGSIGAFIQILLNAGLVLTLFTVFPAHIWYSTLAALIVVPFTACWGLWHKNRLLPWLKVKKSQFSLAHLKEILSSGLWRTLQATGELLLSGLDLLICNLLINPTMMGVLAVSKMLPALLGSLNSSVPHAFAPQMMMNYAANRKDDILREMRYACKTNAVIGTIPLAGLIVFGKEFFALWQPTQNAAMLQILSILACGGLLFVVGIQPISNVFVATNKVKPQAVSVIISGVANTIIVLLCVKFTEWGIYAVAGTSTVILVIRNIFYTTPAAARYLGFKWHEFFFGFRYAIMGSAFVVTIGYVVRYIFVPHSWLTLLLACLFTGILGLATNGLAIFNTRERKILWTKLKGLF